MGYLRAGCRYGRSSRD